MVLARTDVRRRLGLTAAPDRDPDISAGRLRVGDAELQRLLFPAPPGKPRTASTGAPVTRCRRPVTRRCHHHPHPYGMVDRRARIRRGHDGLRAPRRHPYLGRPDAGVGRHTARHPGAPRPGACGRGPGRQRFRPRPDVDGLLLVGQPAAGRDLLGTAASARTTTCSPRAGCAPVPSSTGRPRGVVCWGACPRNTHPGRLRQRRPCHPARSRTRSPGTAGTTPRPAIGSRRAASGAGPRSMAVASPGAPSSSPSIAEASRECSMGGGPAALGRRRVPPADATDPARPVSAPLSFARGRVVSGPRGGDP